MTYLLWTERPVLLDRERETHDWMTQVRPWEVFGLDLIHDNAPGDWRHYSEAFRAAWARATAESTGLINLESDVVPTLDAFAQLLNCPEAVCMVPYNIRDFHGGAHLGYSATVEHRIPGGWDAHLARFGDLWAAYGDLGFLRLGPGAARLEEIVALPPLTSDTGMWNMAVFDAIKPRRPEGKAVHLHWPALKNNHLSWDTGDGAHWPEPKRRELDALHADRGPLRAKTP